MSSRTVNYETQRAREDNINISSILSLPGKEPVTCSEGAEFSWSHLRIYSELLDDYDSKFESVFRMWLNWVSIRAYLSHVLNTELPVTEFMKGLCLFEMALTIIWSLSRSNTRRLGQKLIWRWGIEARFILSAHAYFPWHIFNTNYLDLHRSTFQNYFYSISYI